MTVEELEKLGIYQISPKFYPRKFGIDGYGEFIIPENYTIADIFQLIYKQGYKEGTEKGKLLKIKEIRSCLDLDE